MTSEEAPSPSPVLPTMGRCAARTSASTNPSLRSRASGAPPLRGIPVSPTSLYPHGPLRGRGESQSIWRNRDFMLLWAAQAIGQTAQNAVNYGLMVLVQTYTASATHMSVAVLTVVVPSVVFGLVAGAYVDRRDKRWVMIWTNLLRA